MRKKANSLPLTPRQRLDALMALAGPARKIRVIIYANPDPDALASALALKAILDTDTRKVEIGYTGAIGRPENAWMIKHLRIPAAPVTEAEAGDADLIAVVDAQPQFFKDFALPRCDIVIDHHPPMMEKAPPFADVRPDFLATSSIMAEYLRAAGVRLTKRLASALFYGIKVDSRHFMANLGPGDVDAIRWLRKKADRDVVRRIDFSQFSRETLDYFSIALVRRRFVKGVMLSHLGPVPMTDVCVQIADFLIRVAHVRWAVVTGVVGDRLVVVFRNDGLKKDAGFLARSAFGKIGSAGGHKDMGRAEISQKDLPGGLLLTDNLGVERFVVGALAAVDPAFSPVLRALRPR